MHMSFWFGTNLGTFLFDGYNVNTFWGFISTCLGLTALAILYEGMKIMQIKLRENTAQSLISNEPFQNYSPVSRMSTRLCNCLGSACSCCTFTKWVAEVFHYTVHVTLGYILMLAIMTFNIYIVIAVIFGSGIGYFIFGPALLELKMSNIKKQHQVIMQCDPSCMDPSANPELEPSSSNSEGQIEPQANIEVHTS